MATSRPIRCGCGPSTASVPIPKFACACGRLRTNFGIDQHTRLPAMNSFSASDAALEGFQVIRTHWRVALGWCLFSIVGFVGLVIVAFFVILAAAFVVTSKEQAGTAGGLI